MIYKKKFLLLIILLIIIVQTILFVNNKQKTSFRYFKWAINEVTTGKLISISFFSGLFFCTIINPNIIIQKKETLENFEENYESFKNVEDVNNNNIEMPPQRDIRDAQPTISVNYRVVKNIEENNFKNDKNYSNSPINNDDWSNDDNEW